MSEVVADSAATAVRTDIFVNGVRLRVLRWGSGAPLLLLHGVTDSAALWRRVGDALAPAYEIVAIDQRGHGESDRSTTYRYEHLIADAAEAIRQLRLGPVVVIGHSMGATVGLNLAAQHPALVRRLVMVDPALRARGAYTAEDHRNLWAWRAELEGLSEVELMAVAQIEHPAWPIDDVRAWAISQQQFAPAVAELEGGLDPFREWRTAAAATVCPVLIVRGEESCGSLLPDAQAAEAAALIADCRVLQFAGTGHLPHLDRCDDFLNALTDWMV